MIEQSVSLAPNGVVKVPGYEQLVRFGYTKNRSVYRLHVDTTGEWKGMTIRAFWHVPDGKDPASSLVVDGYVAVPASVTAQPEMGASPLRVVMAQRPSPAQTFVTGWPQTPAQRTALHRNRALLHGSSWWMPCAPMPPPQSKPRLMHRRPPEKPTPVRAMQTRALRKPLTACRS